MAEPINLAALVAALQGLGVRRLELELEPVGMDRLLAAAQETPTAPDNSTPKDPTLCSVENCPHPADSRFVSGLCRIHGLQELGVRHD